VKWTAVRTRILLTAFIGLGLTWIATAYLNSSLQASSSSSSPSSTNAPVINDIRCDIMEHFNIHIHSHLDIFINGEAYLIPSNIGIIPNQCIYWLHTHDDTGVIHIESPEERIFTLGEFFDIWGEEFSNSGIFDSIVEESIGNSLEVFVNGKQVTAETDFRQIPINEHDEIAIIYGKPPYSIPSNYEFPEGL
jgi:hypothetical protein